MKRNINNPLKRYLLITFTLLFVILFPHYAILSAKTAKFAVRY